VRAFELADRRPTRARPRLRGRSRFGAAKASRPKAGRQHDSPALL